MTSPNKYYVSQELEPGNSKSGSRVIVIDHECLDDNNELAGEESKTNAKDSTGGATDGRRSERNPIPFQRFKDIMYLVVPPPKRKRSLPQSVAVIPSVTEINKEEPRAKVSKCSKVNIDLKKVETMLNMQSKNRDESNANMGLVNIVDQSASQTLALSGQTAKLRIKTTINTEVSDNQEKQQSDIVVPKNNNVNYSISVAEKHSVNTFINKKPRVNKVINEKDSSTVTKKDSSYAPVKGSPIVLEKSVDKDKSNTNIEIVNTVDQSASIIRNILTEKLKLKTVINTKTADNQDKTKSVIAAKNDNVKYSITFAGKDNVDICINEKDSLPAPEKDFVSAVPGNTCLSISEKDNLSLPEIDSVNESSKTCITGNLNHSSSEPEKDTNENHCGNPGAVASLIMKYPTLSPDFVMAFHCQDIKVFRSGTMFVYPYTEANKGSFSVSCTLTSAQLQLLSDSSTKKMIGDQLVQAESVLNMSNVLEVPPPVSNMNMNEAMTKIALLNDLVKTQSQLIISLKNKRSKRGKTLNHESQMNKISSLSEMVESQFKEICSLNQTVKSQSERMLSLSHIVKSQSERLLSSDQTVRCLSEQISFWIEMIKAQAMKPISFKELNVKIQNEIEKRQTNTVKKDDKNVSIDQMNTGKEKCVNNDESFTSDFDNNVNNDFIEEENGQVITSQTYQAGDGKSCKGSQITTVKDDNVNNDCIEEEKKPSYKRNQITTKRAFNQAVNENGASSILKKLFEEKRKQTKSADINQQQNKDDQLTCVAGNGKDFKGSQITTEKDNNINNDCIEEENIPTNDQVLTSQTVCAGRENKIYQCAVITGSQLKTKDRKSYEGNQITTNRAFNQAVHENSASSILKKLCEEKIKQTKSTDISQQQITDNQLTSEAGVGKGCKGSRITTEEVIKKVLSSKKFNKSPFLGCSKSHQKRGSSQQQNIDNQLTSEARDGTGCKESQITEKALKTYLVSEMVQNSSVSDCPTSHKVGGSNQQNMAIDNQNTGKNQESWAEFFASRLRKKKEKEEQRERRQRLGLKNVFDPPKLCECCGAVFKYRKAYHEHVNVVNGRFKCGICKLRCRNGRNLLKHINVHLKKSKRGQKYSCEDCSSSFKSRQGLQYHNCYAKKKIFTCSKCKAEFPNHRSLVTHRWSKHTPRKVHKCKICGANFTEEKLLRNHIPKHFIKDCDKEGSEDTKKAVDMILI